MGIFERLNIYIFYAVIRNVSAYDNKHVTIYHKQNINAKQNAFIIRLNYMTTIKLRWVISNILKRLPTL